MSTISEENNYFRFHTKEAVQTWSAATENALPPIFWLVLGTMTSQLADDHRNDEEGMSKAVVNRCARYVNRCARYVRAWTTYILCISKHVLYSVLSMIKSRPLAKWELHDHVMESCCVQNSLDKNNLYDYDYNYNCNYYYWSTPDLQLMVN